LLLLIIENAAIKPDYEFLANKLSNDDVPCTPKAVLEHVKKLKAQARESAT